MTAKEIYQTIKEKPYRDGEALILDFAKAFASDFYEWENVYSGNPPLSVGYSEEIVHRYTLEKYIDVSLCDKIISERDKTIQVVIELIERMQDQGHAFPDDFIKRVRRCKYNVK